MLEIEKEVVCDSGGKGFHRRLFNSLVCPLRKVAAIQLYGEKGVWKSWPYS